MRDDFHNCPNPHHYPEYHVGPHHDHHPCHPHDTHYHCGKVGIIGKLVLKVKYIDHHGHTQYFDIVEGETYIIEAISQTKGRCKFAGRIVDFDSSKGVEKILSAPHVIDIGSIIVDYSNDYESKLIRIRVDNLISIKPIENCDYTCPNDYRPDDHYIKDPFADQILNCSIEKAEQQHGCCCQNDPYDII